MQREVNMKEEKIKRGKGMGEIKGQITERNKPKQQKQEEGTIKIYAEEKIKINETRKEER
jgi:hypothetical protein